MCPVTGVILAGGRGRRFDGRDKGLLELSGRPLIEHVLRALAPQVDEILINANRNLPVYERYGYRVVADTVPEYQGPLAGMLAGLRQAQYGTVAIVPCDMPYLPDCLVSRLGQVQAEGDADVVIPHDGGRSHPVICLMRRVCADHIESWLAQGRYRVGEWVSAQRHAVADFSDMPDGFRNINRPGDLP